MTNQHNRFTLTKDEWLDLIVDNLVTEEQIDRIIENENLRQKIIELRDSPPITTQEVIERLISFTEDLESNEEHCSDSNCCGGTSKEK